MQSDFAERPFALWRWSDSDRDLVRRQGGSGVLESHATAVDQSQRPQRWCGSRKPISWT